MNFGFTLSLFLSPLSSLSLSLFPSLSLFLFLSLSSLSLSVVFVIDRPEKTADVWSTRSLSLSLSFSLQANTINATYTAIDRLFLITFKKTIS